MPIKHYRPEETLLARYAKEREQNRIPVEVAPGKEITVFGLLRSDGIKLRMLSLIAQSAGGQHGDSYR
ncbi:MAG: hypothetical protein PHO89_01680 [Methylacidiphilaceae bacterium]|nr:hypothetical protein [Candidatus Methylacidiphilaceae bacterium]